VCSSVCSEHKTSRRGEASAEGARSIELEHRTARDLVDDALVGVGGMATVYALSYFIYIYISGSACSTVGVHSQAWSTSGIVHILQLYRLHACPAAIERTNNADKRRDGGPKRVCITDSRGASRAFVFIIMGASPPRPHAPAAGFFVFFWGSAPRPPLDKLPFGCSVKTADGLCAKHSGMAPSGSAARLVPGPTPAQRCDSAVRRASRSNMAGPLGGI
jgi:hypothetical protein